MTFACLMRVKGKAVLQNESICTIHIYTPPIFLSNHGIDNRNTLKLTNRININGRKIMSTADTNKKYSVFHETEKEFVNR